MRKPDCCVDSLFEVSHHRHFFNVVASVGTGHGEAHLSPFLRKIPTQSQDELRRAKASHQRTAQRKTRNCAKIEKSQRVVKDTAPGPFVQETHICLFYRTPHALRVYRPSHKPPHQSNHRTDSCPLSVIQNDNAVVGDRSSGALQK